MNTENPWSKPELRAFQRFSSNTKVRKLLVLIFIFDKTKSYQLPVRNHD